MKQFDKIELKTFERNFRAHFNNMLFNNPTLYVDGLKWYKKENLHIKKVAKRYNMTIKTYAEITARLSVRNNWYRNRLDAVRLSYNRILKRANNAIKVCTTKVHKNKAYEHYDGISNIEPNALKIYAFAKNLQLDANHITIDIWIKRAFTNCYNVKKFDMNAKQYEQLSNIVFRVAKENELLGYQCQAIAWNSARSNVWNKDTKYIKGMYSLEHKQEQAKQVYDKMYT